MSLIDCIRLVALLLSLTYLGGVWGADAPRDSRAQRTGGVTVGDTGRPAAEEPALAGLASENDWTAIPVGQGADICKDDAVVTNGRSVPQCFHDAMAFAGGERRSLSTRNRGSQVMNLRGTFGAVMLQPRGCSTALAELSRQEEIR